MISSFVSFVFSTCKRCERVFDPPSRRYPTRGANICCIARLVIPTDCRKRGFAVVRHRGGCPLLPAVVRGPVQGQRRGRHLAALGESSPVHYYQEKRELCPVFW